MTNINIQPSEIPGLLATLLQHARQEESFARVLDGMGLLAYMVHHWRGSHAQLRQDLWVEWELRAIPAGERFAVEVGAADGITLSNTRRLAEAGWRRLLVEPNPDHVIDALPTDIIDRRAAWNSTGQTVQLALCSDRDLSAVLGAYAATHRPDTHQRDIHRVVDVETVQLKHLLGMHQIETVHYLSIDVEGAEYEVLGGMDFQRWPVPLVSIEHNNIQAREMELDDRMRQAGYQRVYRGLSQWDAWYRRHQ
jgi:FkbM family methyltransferase